MLILPKLRKMPRRTSCAESCPPGAPRLRRRARRARAPRPQPRAPSVAETSRAATGFPGGYGCIARNSFATPADLAYKPWAANFTLNGGKLAFPTPTG